MLSANVSAFSIRKAVGGGAAPVPYVLEFRIIGGGGSTSNWLYAAGGAAAGAFANYTVTEPAAGIAYTLTVGAGAAALASDSASKGTTGSVSYLNQGGTTLTRGAGGSYGATEGYNGGVYEPPQIQTQDRSGGGGSGPGGASSNVRNVSNTHTNGYDGGDSTPGGNSVIDGGVYYANYQGGGGAGQGGAGGDAGLGAFSAGAGGAISASIPSP